MNVENLLVSGDQKRLFINTGIGCEGGCKYCYLPHIGISDVDRNIDKMAIVRDVERREKGGEFIKGSHGTVVSFGCFTECWNENIRKLTLELLLYFINKGNYIQLATKEFIEQNDIELLKNHLKFKNQLTINVSLPVYYKAKQIEPNTEDVKKRIENFKYNKIYEMDIVLYIKPVLENITIKNLDIYIELINKYKLKVIVGNYLEVNRMKGGTLHIIGNQEMWQRDSEQQKKLVMVLKKITQVYENSVQIIEEYRRGEKDVKGMEYN